VIVVIILFKSLKDAKDEICRLRQIAKDALIRNDELERKCSTTWSSSAKRMASMTRRNKNEARAAVMAHSIDKEFVKTTIPKSDLVRNLIYHSIKNNILFRACDEEELQDLIDAFDTAKFKDGETVIKQGDDGDLFFVVEDGKLDILVSKTDPADEFPSSVEIVVGAPYASGSSFGELALMYGSPRAATIRAKTDCVLWCLHSQQFKGITRSHKQKREEIIVETIRKVKIGGSVLGNVLHPDNIDAMVLATETDSFEKGAVIIRQGESGDAFYIIQSGTVDVFKTENGDEAIAHLTSGHFFGEKALLSEDVRQATCIASSDVKCLTLMREDFVRMLGNLQDLIDSNANVTADQAQTHQVEEDLKRLNLSHSYDLTDLQTGRTLGIGFFGRVKIVKIKPGKIPKLGDPNQTYALKCLSKRCIVDSGRQDHVINEKKIMEELNHPFIITFHCAMQDENQIYFLLEVLLGGELFRTLRCEGQFPESWSRFYAASVMLAFCQIHGKKIAYRDLKPENLVMDAEGYLKIVDFGLAKKLEEGKTWTLCGTPDYLAPEVILNGGHDWAVDYWALGVLIYEMTAGTPPFYAEDPMEVYEKILSGHITIPSHFSRSITGLVKKLLKTYQSKRLGRTWGGATSVMKQKWFSGFDWNSLLERKLEVPLKPDVKDCEDASNFDEYPEEEDDFGKTTGWNPVL
jgi:cGMP-dependent protein kinase